MRCLSAAPFVRDLRCFDVNVLRQTFAQVCKTLEQLTKKAAKNADSSTRCVCVVTTD